MVSKTKDEQIESQLLIPKTSAELNAEIAVLEAQKYALDYEENQILKPKIILDDFSLLKKGECFSRNCVYKAYNQKTRVSTKVHGMFVDGLIGLDQDVRQQMLSGNIEKVFSVGNFRIEFVYFEKN